MSIIIKKIWGDDVAILTDKLKRIPSVEKNMADFFVFKVSQVLIESLKGAETAKKEITGRAQKKPVYLIRFDNILSKFEVIQVLESSLSIVNDEKLLYKIRKSDLCEIIDSNTDCLIKAPSGIHFVTPSNKHVIEFLRVADALHSYNALDRLSFWLQEHISKASGIIVDSWSLVSVVLNSQQLMGTKIPFDCFNEHILNDEASALATLNKFSKRIPSEGPLLCVISISSSGLFAQKLSQVVEESQILNSLEVLPLYSFKSYDGEDQPLAKLDFDIECYDEKVCIFCEAGDRANSYVIDPKVYYPRKNELKLLRFKKTLVCDKGTKSPASDFIHKYGSIQGGLVVHKDDPNDGENPRHHAFYIDLLTLLKDKDFRADVEQRLSDFASKNGQPTVVITPPHDAGRELGGMVEELWGSTHMEHHNLMDLSEEEQENLTLAEHICFLDDVFITGARGSQYLRSLREEFGEGELLKLKKITWLPIVARPPSKKDIQAFEDSISNHSGWETMFSPVFVFELPHWTSKIDCPWCQESMVLEKKIGAQFEEPVWYKDRRSLLSSGGIGTEPLFILPNTDRKVLGKASALGEEGCTEIQLLFLISSGLQIMRNDPVQPLGRDLLQSYVLRWYDNEENATFMRYSEPLIQTVFLKTLKMDEWHDDVFKEDILTFARNIIASNAELAAGELVVFFNRTKPLHCLPSSFVEGIKNKCNDKVFPLLLER